MSHDLLERGGIARHGVLARVELTILMPCLNERATIGTCIGKAQRFLSHHGVNGEVIIADNGSADGSQFIAAGLGVRVIAVKERGYGAALAAGIKGARGDYVIMGDADDSYDFENLDAMLAALRSGSDLVMGNRFKGGIARGAMPMLHRYLGNPVLSFLGRLFFAAPIGDFHCGLRGFSRQAIGDLHLHSPGMEFASEMVIKASLFGLRITEVPVRLAVDGRGREPHLRTWHDGWRHLRLLLLHTPRWLFLYPGLILVVAGLSGMALPAGRPTAQGLDLGIHAVLASSFAALIGTQLVMLGALARRWGMIEGFLPAGLGLRRFLFGMTLEAVLQGAFVVFLCGTAGLVWSTHRWITRDAGQPCDLCLLQGIVASLTAVGIAVQSGAAAFFGSILATRQQR